MKRTWVVLVLLFIICQGELGTPVSWANIEEDVSPTQEAFSQGIINEG